jgi:hypothetical protein
MEKQYYDKHDIMNIFGCGKDKALQIIRCIKDFTGDRLKIQGKVLVSEFNEWNLGIKNNQNVEM